MGPPSGVGTCEAEAAIYVPTSPNIRMQILIASFMVFLLPQPRLSQKGIRGADQHYKVRVKPDPQEAASCTISERDGPARAFP
jgi:hypothetical protein